MKKRIITAIAVCVPLIILTICINTGIKTSYGKNNAKYELITVVSVISDNTEKDKNSNSGLYIGTQKLNVEILTGEHIGDVVETINTMSLYYNINIAPGMLAVASVKDSQDGEYTVDIYTYFRLPVILCLLTVFFGLIIWIGGKKGLKSLLGLMFTIFCVTFLLIPLILKGYSAVLSAVFVGGLTTVVTLFLLDGASKKTFSAIIGTVFGVAASGITAFVMSYFAKLTIFSENNAEALLQISLDMPFDIKGILFAGIIISALGAVMDVGISISSSVCELYYTGNINSRKRLFRSGMNIGRDMMGTMINTLILAFAGSSFSLFILLYSYQLPLMQLLNTDMIGMEILEAISGTIGIISTVPITSFITSYILTRSNELK